jgi:uncharacterized protein YegP (UPF0339 family)/uncharacterized surface protein with fasciclin (FAS1) repeats
VKITEDIVDIAVAAGGFKTFITAVKAAGLVETLKGQGPFTIFAPDDRAFSLLPVGSVDELLKNVPKLKAILMYHVVSGKFTVDEIGQMKTVKTLQGQEIQIDGSKYHLHMNPVINNDAHIVNTDVITDNGIVHVVDRVLMPNMDLTCPMEGMGFMTKQALDEHTKTAHVFEKTTVTSMPAEVMPVVEQAPEQMPVTDVLPEVEKAPEQMPSPAIIPEVEAAPEPLPPTEVITEQFPVTAKVTGVFEVFYDSVCRFRFHLKATNGQIIAVSQSYGTKESALKGIASIKKNAPIAEITDFTAEETMTASAHRGVVQDPAFEIQCDSAGKFRFHLKAANGEIIATSQSYLSRQSTEKGIVSIKKNAPTARIIDQTTAVT